MRGRGDRVGVGRESGLVVGQRRLFGLAEAGDPRLVIGPVAGPVRQRGEDRREVAGRRARRHDVVGTTLG